MMKRFAKILLMMGISAVLLSCSPVGSPIGLNSELRTLSPEMFSRKAVAYSGYRGSTRDIIPTETQIKEDMELLLAADFRLIRLFAADEMARRTLKVIHDNNFDIKVMLGAWIDGPKATADAANKAQLDAAADLANQYADIVLAVSVGNETMVEWSKHVPPSDIADYVTYMKRKVTQPVTTDDNWAVFANDGNKYAAIGEVLSVIDFVSMHTYPLADSMYDLWDWKQTNVGENTRASAMMDAAIQKAKADYQAVKNHIDATGRALPIVIGETGWKSIPSNSEYYRAHPVNQKMYYDRLVAWKNEADAKPDNIFYFEAFDEPWKGGDDKWGLFDAERKAKYVLYDLFPSNRETENYSENDAVYYIPVVANSPIDKDRYVVYRDAPIDPATEAQPAVNPASGLSTQWIGWNIPWTASFDTVSMDTFEGENCMKITPVPESWGWGALLEVKIPDDLTAFETSGYLNFAIKTTYPGKLEVGFLTGLAADRDACDVYLPISPGQYHYQNDGNWHMVSIPIADITPKAAPAYNMPSTATLNMAKVTNAFVIADTYSVTGNAGGSTAPIYVDNIYWSK
jgi:exo-beta-1,3-glucanase (GH17 family)